MPRRLHYQHCATVCLLHAYKGSTGAVAKDRPGIYVIRVLESFAVLCVMHQTRKSVAQMATIELIKKDYMMKRSQMKSRIKSENYRHRWFELLPLVLRYSDGNLDVRIFSYFFKLITVDNYHCSPIVPPLSTVYKFDSN